MTKTKNTKNKTNKTEANKEDSLKNVKNKINQSAIFKIIAEIPCGSVTTYQIVSNVFKARHNFASNPVRAVATIIGKNPNLITVPCHRIVLSSGKIGKYANGTLAKISLLENEGLQIANNKIINFNNKIYRFPNDLY